MNNLKCNQIRQTSSTGTPLLDVCTTDEFRNDAVYLNVKNIPLAVLPLLAQQYFERDEPILIYCHSDSRTIIAGKILTSLDFTDAINMGDIHHYQ